MRKRIVAFLTAGLLLAGAGSAMAAAPGGSSESGNNVTCGGQQRVGDFTVYGGTNGATVCSDGGAIQGRAYVDTNRKAVAIDGENDNSPDQLDGYILIDGSNGNAGCGPNSTGPGGARDSESGQASAQDCQPD